MSQDWRNISQLETTPKKQCLYLTQVQALPTLVIKKQMKIFHADVAVDVDDVDVDVCVDASCLKSRI